MALAPSFNGRTAASGAAYRGSNPWGAANLFSNLVQFLIQALFSLVAGARREPAHCMNMNLNFFIHTQDESAGVFHAPLLIFHAETAFR
ncbi:MAG: hypothetical protein JWM83_2874 [Candidatus Angelobacter sp.]|nr:hypothetical protein [Candidatus Angelobacter sp.]